MKYGLLFVCLMTFSVGYAAVYKTVEDGSVSYTDTPENGATEVSPTVANQVSSTLPDTTPPTPAKSNSLNQSAKPSAIEPTPVKSSVPAGDMPYNTFAIESPADQETIQNQPLFSVKIKLDPPLQDGDKVQLMLDGQPFGAPSTTMEISVENVDRGEHRLSAVLLDKRNTVIKRSNVITIYIHRASQLNRSSALKPAPAVTSPLQELTIIAKELIVTALGG